MAIIGFSDQLYVVSILVQIPAGTSTVTIDKTLAWGTKPIGAILITSDCKYGDVGELTVVHPVIGQLDTFGAIHLPEGNRDLTIYVPDNHAEVPAGLIYRLTVTAIDSNGRNVIVWLLVKR